MTWPGVANSGEFLHSTGGGPSLIDFADAAGDVTGGVNATTVVAVQGEAVSSTPPASGDVFQYDGSEWAVTPITDIDMDSHTMLNGVRHTDTVAHVPVQGDIVIANGTPAWDALSLGTLEFVLFSNGTDVAYTRLGAPTPFSLGTEAAPSMTYTGDLDTGWSAEVADELVGSAGGSGLMTLDGNNLRTNWVGGQSYHVTNGGTRTLAASDNVVLVNAAPATITLPAAPGLGQLYYIKDTDGNASGATRITIAGNGNSIDGNASIEIKNSYGAFTLLYNGTLWNVL